MTLGVPFFIPRIVSFGSDVKILIKAIDMAPLQRDTESLLQEPGPNTRVDLSRPMRIVAMSTQIVRLSTCIYLISLLIGNVCVTSWDRHCICFGSFPYTQIVNHTFLICGSKDCSTRIIHKYCMSSVPVISVCYLRFERYKLRV